jgi:hypothetical protein
LKTATLPAREMRDPSTPASALSKHAMSESATSEPAFPTPEAAEAAFYAAFEARSLDAMMAVWATTTALPASIRWPRR